MPSAIAAFFKGVARTITPVDNQGNPLPVDISGGGTPPLVIAEAKATAADPVYVEGTENPLSQTLDGYLRVAPKAAMKIQNIVSSPVAPGPNVNLLADIVYITSSGSGGNEYINIPNPTPTTPFGGDASLTNHVILVETATLTNPADSPRVYISGAGTFKGQALLQNGVIQAGTLLDGVILDFVGAASGFLCAYYGILWCPFYAGYDEDTPAAQLSPVILSGFESNGSKGGEFGIKGGDCVGGVGDGGDALWSAGAGHGGGVPGKFVMNNTVDAAAAAAGTLLNAPSAGNPARWVKMTIDGTVYAIPAWTV